MTRTLRTLLLLVCVASAGCGTNIARYGHSRMLDLMDSVPTSVAGGLGLLAEVRATPLVGLGIGYANTTRYGTDDQRFGPVWTEKERGYPIVMYYRVQAYEDREGRFYGGDPIWWEETYRARGSSWIVLPGFPRDGDFFTPLPAPLDQQEPDLWTFEPWLPFTPAYVNRVQWHWPWFSWINILNVELGVVAGPVGLRLGVSPIQLVDFVGGIFLIDFARDDVREFPVLWPDPDAKSSFPEGAATPAPPDVAAPPASSPKQAPRSTPPAAAPAKPDATPAPASGAGRR